MIKHIVRSAFVAVVITAVVARGAQAQNTNTVNLTVPTTNSFSVSNSEINLAPDGIAAGFDTSYVTDGTATYSVATNTGGATAGKVDASILGVVPSGTTLSVLFDTNNGNTVSEVSLNDAATTPVTVLDGLANESDTAAITYKYVVTPTAVAGATAAITVTYTFTAGT